MATMNSFFKQKTQFFNHWASIYDCSLTTVFYQAIHQRLLTYVELSAQANILDLGCGTGKLLNRLCDKFPEIKGTGVDLSPEMLRQARAANQHHPRLIFCEGNAESLPFVPNQFDAVFNTISFLHYPNPQNVFAEISRVLLLEGYFYLVDYVGTTKKQYLSITPGGLHFYNPQQREAFAINVGLICCGHYHLFGPVMLSIFQRSR
jgi:SAM-dependent methyltransferase